jgi:hypothetical protein
VVLVATAAWVATDWALLEIDEWRYREQRIAGWEAQLQQLRVEMEEGLMRHFEDAITGGYDALQREVERGFSPLASQRNPEWRAVLRPRGDG